MTILYNDVQNWTLKNYLMKGVYFCINFYMTQKSIDCIWKYYKELFIILLRTLKKNQAIWLSRNCFHTKTLNIKLSQMKCSLIQYPTHTYTGIGDPYVLDENWGACPVGVNPTLHIVTFASPSFLDKVTHN